MQHLQASQFAVLLLSLALLIGAARLLGKIARYFRQPSVVGELLAGVLLGPTVFGALAPSWQAYMFPTHGENAVVLDGVSSLAIVLFLLVAGVEVDLSTVWKQGRSALKVGLLATLIPFAIGLAGALIIPEALGRQSGADRLVFALFLATAMAISALPVIAKTLMDLNLYRTDLGMVVISAAILNDLFGWTVFALILGMMSTHGAGVSVMWTVLMTAIYAGLVLTVGRWLIHRWLPYLQAYTHWPGGVLGFAVTLALLGGAITEIIGVHAIFGAFLIGVALGDSPHLQERTRVMLDEVVSFIFAPLFFASIGLKVDFLPHFDPFVVTWVIVLACVSKVGGAVLGARWGGFSVRDRWAIGFAMNARGAMEIILGVLAFEAGVISQPLFVAIVIMALITSAMSGPMIRQALRRRQSHRLLSVVSGKHFIRNMTATSRIEAIHELSELAAKAANLNAESIQERAWKREGLAATGIGNGVALPHARLPGLKEPIVVVGLSDGGIEFDAPDGQLAHAIFLLVTPAEDPNIQLDLSAEIAATFRKPNALERVLRATNFTQFLAVVKTLAPSNHSFEQQTTSTNIRVIFAAAMPER